MTNIQFANTLLIAENDHGYQFAVGQLASGNWAGFAIGWLDDGGRMLFLFSEVSDGITLGVSSRDDAIRMTGAIAQDPEHSYGGVSRWHVAEELRCHPDEYRCENCCHVGCDGVECLDWWDHEGD